MQEFEFVDAASPIPEGCDVQDGICGRPFSPHQGVPGVSGMGPYLQALREYRDARTVLIVDDGVASAMARAVRNDRKVYYLMDPHDGSIVQPQSGSPWKYNLQGFPPQSSFSRLPHFDLVLTGCHGMADGCLYTSGDWLLKAFDELRRHGKVGDHTCVVAVVNQYQYDYAAPFNLCFARASCAIVDGVGVTYAGNPQCLEAQHLCFTVTEREV